MIQKRPYVLPLLIAFLTIVSSCKKEEDDPLEPQACMEIPQVIEAGTATEFSSVCSQNADSVVWTFGEGGSSTEPNPEYTFSSGGTYTITLTVVNQNGQSNTATQTVNVEAPEFYEHSGNITEDETWVEGIHILTGDVYVRGAILTIEPGAEVRFNLGRGLYVGYYNTSGSTLIAEGDEDKKITFTSTANTKSPGDWDNIGFYEGNSNSSRLTYCVLEYGGGNSSRGAIHLDEANVSIENTEIVHSGAIGISAGNNSYFSSFTNNEISDTESFAISIASNYAGTIGAGNTINTERGIEVKGGRLEDSEVTWMKQMVPYVITGDLYLGSSSGSILNIDPGAQVQFASGRGLYVGYYGDTFGTLVAEGTSTDRIVFSSAAVDKSPGDWDLIGFYAGSSSNNSLKYCDIEYGGGNSSKGLVDIPDAEITIENCKISYSENSGVSLGDDSKFVSFSNNEISNVGTFAVQIYANAAHTLGSNNTFDSPQGIAISGDRVEIASGTWLNHGAPYVATGDIYIGSATGTEITIEAGTTFSFTQGRGLFIGYYSGTFGKLIAQGNAGNEILFTSAAPEGSKAAGSWDYVGFYSGTSSGSILDNCIVEYGGSSRGNVYCTNTSAGTPTISNCIIRNSGAYGINISGDNMPTLTGNTFSNNDSGDTNLNL